MNGKLHCVLLTGHIPHGTLHRRVSCKLHCNIKKKEHIALFSKILTYLRDIVCTLLKKKDKTKNQTFILPKFKQSSCFEKGRGEKKSCKLQL